MARSWPILPQRSMFESVTLKEQHSMPVSAVNVTTKGQENVPSLGYLVGAILMHLGELDSIGEQLQGYESGRPISGPHWL